MPERTEQAPVVPRCQVCGGAEGTLGICRASDGMQTAYYYFNCANCKKSYLEGMVCGPWPGHEELYRELVAQG